jgi:hypothetical protein
MTKVDVPFGKKIEWQEGEKWKKERKKEKKKGE